MRFVFPWLCAILFVCSAFGQTKQSRTGWADAIKQFGASVVEGDLRSARAVCISPMPVRTLDSEATVDLPSLVLMTDGGRLLASHGYIHPPTTMAADLAKDFKNASDIPDGVRTQMTPSDPEQMRSANATAASWFAQVLQIADKTPVGVIVIWPTSGDRIARESPSPVFILVRGAEVSAGDFRITGVAFGAPVLGDE